MNKKEFLNILGQKLSDLPKKEVKETITFYSEMIDDRIEEGISEEEVILEIGDIDLIVEQILNDVPSEKNEVKKPLSKLELILLAIGSPIWATFLLVGFIIIWTLTVVLWAIELPFYIFSFISKYLIIVCLKITNLVIAFTKSFINKVSNVFKS